MLVGGAALFVALGGSAVAADRMIGTKDIAPSAVTSSKIKNGSVALADLHSRTRSSLRGRTGPSGTNGATGATGATGGSGAAGAGGAAGATGAAGANGLSGTNGANGANGPNGVDGAGGSDGINGTNGTNGTNGADGVLGPRSATAGFVPLPTGAPPTTVVTLAVPAGNYVVLAKTQLTHSGAGDSINCTLKAGTSTIDQGSMKTHPALAAIPVSLQAVTTTAPTQLSLECAVAVADGSANFSSLIALPVG